MYSSIIHPISLLDFFTYNLAKLRNMDCVENVNPIHLVGSEVVTVIFIHIE
jgi:hypothetical protein